MFKEVFKFLKNLYIPTLDNSSLCILKNDKEAIDKNIEKISLFININFDPGNFFLEPDNSFYNNPPQAQARYIQNKIGLRGESAIHCPIKFSGGGILDTSAGKFIQKTKPKALFDTESKTLEWVKDETQKLEIEISNKFKDSPALVAGILAHELTHLYFYTKGISKLFPNQQTEEQCCDLTIFLLGLGKLVMNSFAHAATYQDGDKIICTELRHYLPWYELCYIYERVNMLKHIPKEIARKNLNKDAITKLETIRRHAELFESLCA